MTQPIAQYATFTDLPDRDHAKEGDVAVVSTTGEIYQFVENIGGDYAGLWLPVSIANQDLDYVRDGQGDPARLLADHLPEGWRVEVVNGRAIAVPPPLNGWDDDPLDI